MTTSKRYWIRNVDKAWRIQQQRIMDRRTARLPVYKKVLVETRKSGVLKGARYLNNPPKNCQAWFTVTYHYGTIFPSGITFVVNS